MYYIILRKIKEAPSQLSSFNNGLSFPATYRHFNVNVLVLYLMKLSQNLHYFLRFIAFIRVLFVCGVCERACAIIVYECVVVTACVCL